MTLLLITSFGTAVSAETIKFDCTFDRFANTFGIVVDLDNGIMFHGDDFLQHAFSITEVTENFLTAQGAGKLATSYGPPFEANAPKHGGSIYVINRRDGSLYFSSVGLNCSLDGCSPEPVNLQIETGKCNKVSF